MLNVIVFAGTTEGYEIARFLQKNHISTYICVATDYGTRSLEPDEFLTVHAQRLDESEMASLFLEQNPALVIDATHPYAAEVTKNIKAACNASNCQYLRVLRTPGETTGQEIYVESTADAVEYLKTTEGNVLLTTGSKELSFYTEVPDYRDRLYARVLSLPSVVSACAELGFEGKHLIGMQGPFSRELDEAMLRQYNCRYLVTKNTGKAGGFQEKLDAAHNCNVIPIVIGRPMEETGISVAECKRHLTQQFSLTLHPAISIVGIGMGHKDTLTIEGQREIARADLLIGAERMVNSVRDTHHATHYEYRSEQIASYIQQHTEYERIVIVMSGDVGFYSGARKLLQLLPSDTRVYCGISSVVYFMAKIGLSWDDAKIVSAHGRRTNLVSEIRHNEKVFAILGTKDGVRQLAQKLTNYHMGKILLWVGENLSYPEESVFCRTASELTTYEGDALSVVCAVNTNAAPIPATHGLPDDAFLRGKAPMTKEEVRAVSLSKLRLERTSVCYDIGAGTGSVSIEMALRADQGMVYAIEKKDDALNLLRENKQQFAADNLEIVSGTAPEAMIPLESPTHAFIGGSSGNLREIVELLLLKNPRVQIVINCITLETVSEALEVIRMFEFDYTDIVCLNAARSKSVGRYHMMMGENPIYIITCRRESE